MKSLLRTLLISFFFLLSISSFSQSSDPNAKVKAMGLTDQDISDLCKAAYGKIQQFYDWNIPTVWEIIYDLEGKAYPEFSSKKEAHQFLKEIWEKKYSCIYCRFSAEVKGSLDMMGLYFGEGGPNGKHWVRNLYSPTGPVRANVNLVRPYIISQWAEDVEGTLLDYVNYTLEKPTTEMRRYPSKWDYMKAKAKRVKEEWGGKSISEMTPEEIEENRCK